MIEIKFCKGCGEPLSQYDTGKLTNGFCVNCYSRMHDEDAKSDIDSQIDYEEGNII